MNQDDVAVLVRYRLEQAEVALSDARFLLDSNRSSLSIVNRAYYAMFYAAVALFQKSGTIPSKHTGVIALFDTEYVLKGVFSKDHSRNLHRAFELRQVSDYKPLQRIPVERAGAVVEHAKEFVQAVRAYLLGGV